MKRGAAPKFKDLGSSPMKHELGEKGEVSTIGHNKIYGVGHVATTHEEHKALKSTKEEKKEEKPKEEQISPTKHRIKSSGAYEAKTGAKEVVDTHAHPHTKKVDEIAEHHKKAKKKQTKVRTNDPAYLDIRSREETRQIASEEKYPSSESSSSRYKRV